MIDALDTALVIEGGGMRNSYTAPCIVKLIQEQVQFGWVGGVSAGASHTVNYLSQDAIRAEDSFVEFANNPSFGGVGSLMRGRGYFNAEYIYERSADKDLPFNWQAYKDNPAMVNPAESVSSRRSSRALRSSCLLALNRAATCGQRPRARR